MIRAFVIIIAIGIIAVFSSAVFAKTGVESGTNFKKIESIGIYKKPREGSLGRNLWKGAKRSTILTLLEKMPVNSKEPGVQKLISGILLSRARADLIEDDIAPEPGRDILTIRLKKLIEAGRYKQAHDLYELLEQEPYHERLARAGILSMFFTGEKSLACLEVSAIRDKFKASKFIKNAYAYCDIALAEIPDEDSMAIIKASELKILLSLLEDKDYDFSYSFEEFDKLTELEKAVLAGNGKIRVGKLSRKDIQNIPPRYIPLLLHSTGLSEANRFLLTVKSVEWGLLDAAALKEIYAVNLTPSAGTGDETKEASASGSSVEQLSESLKAHEKLPLYFTQAANAAKGDEQWQAIRKAFLLKDEYGISSLLPFADMIDNAEPLDASPEDIFTAWSILTRAGYKISPRWIKILNSVIKNSSGKVIRENAENRILHSLFSAAYLSNHKYSETLKILQDTIESDSKDDAKKILAIKNIIENIDSGKKYDDNDDGIYEKELDFALKLDYVMPSISVWDRLRKSGNNRSVCKTVLLGTGVLRDAALEDIYPGLFQDVLENLKLVGLTEISEDLAMSAVLNEID